MNKFLVFIILFSFFYNNVDAQNQRGKKIDPLCDSSSHETFIICEEMPKYNLENNELERILNDSLNQIPVHKDGLLVISLVVDCIGNTYDYFILRSPDTLISNKIIEALKSNLKWTPGKVRGNPVLCCYTFPFEIGNGVLKLKTTEKKTNHRIFNHKKQ